MKQFVVVSCLALIMGSMTVGRAAPTGQGEAVIKRLSGSVRITDEKEPDRRYMLNGKSLWLRGSNLASRSKPQPRIQKLTWIGQQRQTIYESKSGLSP